MPDSLSFDWIRIAEALDAGVEDLLTAHWEEVALDQGDTPLAPNWPLYRLLEKTGVLRSIGARRAGRLVGYNVFFVQPPIHYSQSLWAVNDIVYLAPAERRGLTGVRLIRAAEALLRGIGVRKVLYHTKRHVHLGHGNARATVGDLLAKMGYLHIEDVLAKTL